MGGCRWKAHYTDPECNEGHIKWLQNIMKAKSVFIINPTIGAEKLAEEDGMVNVAMECSNEGQKTPDTAWFNTL